jgi:hypothetical protein
MAISSNKAWCNPATWDEFNNLIDALYDSWANEELSAFFQFSALAYYLTLVFWGPYYVAGGFTLYLNARTQSEAWDIRLTWQRLSERLRSSSWCVAGRSRVAVFWQQRHCLCRELA